MSSLSVYLNYQGRGRVGMYFDGGSELHIADITLPILRAERVLTKAEVLHLVVPSLKEYFPKKEIWVTFHYFDEPPVAHIFHGSDGYTSRVIRSRFERMLA